MTATLTPAATLVQLDVDLIAPHPHNVRDAVGDVTELAASIAQRGVLQPLTVVTVAAFLIHNPDLAELVEIGDYVTIAGHRRLAAAKLAKASHVPVIVNDALAPAAETVTTMIAENLQRRDLSPMEEARAFQRLRDAKLSERAIAKATGVSPGQVHKRLSLLRLPEKVAAKLGTSLTVADALILLELPTADDIAAAVKKLSPETWNTPRAVVDRHKAEVKRKAVAAETTAALAKAGVEVVDSARDVLGTRYWDHQLDHITTVDQVTNPDDTIAIVCSNGSPLFYSRTVPIDAEDAEEAARDAQVEADSAAGDAAAETRREACARLVGRKLPAALVTEILVEHALADSRRRGINNVAAWLGAELPKTYSGQQEWIEQQAAAGGTTPVRTAIAVALADFESDLPVARNWRGELNVWEPAHIRHVRRLVQHAGHQLSEMEQRLIDHSENPPAPQSTEDDTAVPDA